LRSQELAILFLFMTKKAIRNTVLSLFLQSTHPQATPVFMVLIVGDV
jgi:hypothetical protein